MEISMNKKKFLKNTLFFTIVIMAYLVVVEAKILYDEHPHTISGSLSLWDRDEWGHYGCGTSYIRVEIGDITGGNRIWYEIWECDHGGETGWEKVYSGYIYENDDTGNKWVNTEKWIYVYIENKDAILGLSYSGTIIEGVGGGK